MRIIDQTAKVIKKHDGSSVQQKKAVIPGLSKIQKDKPKPKSKPTTSTQPVRSQVSPHNVDRNQQEEHSDQRPQAQMAMGLHEELTAFMEPFGPIMDWDPQSFDLKDAMALDTKWLEELNFLIPISPSSTRRQSDSKDSSNNSSREKDTIEPVGLQNEFRLVCHYCTHMTRFYSLKDPRWNFYAVVNEDLAYRFRPLKYAILAWSSLHLSILKKEENNLDTAQRYYQQALKELMAEDFATSEIPLDILLVGSFFLCVFDVMASQNQLVSILRHVWTSLRLGALFEPSNLPKMSALSYQVITWMIYLDVRSSLFVGNIQFPNYVDVAPRRVQNSPAKGSSATPDQKNDDNDDVQYLLKSNLYEESVIANIFGHSRAVLQSAFGTRYPSSSVKADNAMDRILVLMVKNMLLFATLVRLRNWLSECGNSLEFHPETLQSKIDELRAETQALFVVHNIQDPLFRFHVLIELALINAASIYFHRLLNPDIRTTPHCQLAATKIIDIAQQLKGLRNPGTPGSLQWPFPLVIAGVETADPVHQSWVLNELEQNNEEGWSIGLSTVRKVVREAVKRQNEQGRRVDIGELMIELNCMVII
ncbi:Sterol regulatory element-binding protein ECM22 [Cyberlindnera fabianii]|uniref:Sterol regulatory element-binding protein ECM22 n=1 Tax=Cyberlindnera fabianii TaxID=36022 RepID=A0A1V2L0W9_CYBFA|nr:Sterol regulatory element-binding protein ECM22 [Cyberlindnera fabianii]